MPRDNTMGGWAFLIGVIIAVIIGLFGSLEAWAAVLLVILGLIIGLLNITTAEVKPFLLAAIALVIVSALGRDVLNIIPQIGTILDAIMALVVPATVIVALREVFTVARR